jgi:hypothetical protein
MFIGGDGKIRVHITFDVVGEALVQAHILGVGRHLTPTNKVILSKIGQHIYAYNSCSFLSRLPRRDYAKVVSSF